MARSYPGIYKRHGRGCRSLETRDSADCNCNGRWVAWVYEKDYVDPTTGKRGRKRKETFDTQAEAKSWRRDAGRLLETGTLPTPTKQTLREAADAWLEGAESGALRKRGGAAYKPSTIRSYRTALEKYVLPELGGLKLSEISRRHVQKFIVEAMHKDGSDPDTIHNAVMPLRVIFRRAVRDGAVAANPTSDLELPARDGTRDRVASPTEAKELLDALPRGHRALWASAFYAGLRRGELQALSVRDVDLAGGTIYVSRSWDAKAGAVEPKSRKGTRRVPIVGTLRDYLTEHIATTGRGDDDYIFGVSPDRPFSPSYIRRAALEAWEAANERRAENELPPLVPIALHECRHTCVSIWHDAGLSLERIGDYVGHSSTYMTDRYRHLLDGHEAEAATLVQAYLDRADTAARLAQVNS